MNKNNEFRTIFSKYNTDKVDHDFFCPVYDELFCGLRNDVRLLFEIGVGHGGSVKGFRDYFPNAHIVGLEINKNRLNFNCDRITIELGNAASEGFTRTVLAKYGNPDIVIDDGSHMSRDIKASFNLLYPFTQKCYVIEDLGTQSFGFKRGHYINDTIPATSMIMGKITDLLLHRGDCTTIKAYPGICFFFK